MDIIRRSGSIGRNYFIGISRKLWVLLLFIILFTGAVSLAEELDFTPQEKEFIQQHPLITVYNDRYWMPFNYFRHGVAQGYTIDYLELLGEKIGIKFGYVSGPSWEEATEMLKRHDIDIIPNFARSSGLEKAVLFTESIIKFIPAVLIKQDADYSGLSDMSGRTVAVVKGQWYEEALRQNYPDIYILPVANNVEAVKAVALGKADGTVGNPVVLKAIWHDSNFTGIKLAGEAKLQAVERYFAGIGIRNDWPLLQSILNKAIRSVTFKEEMSLKDKWLDSGYKTNHDIELSRDEKEFIRNHPVIRVHNEQNWTPFNFNVKGKPQGFTVDLIKILAHKLGIEVKFISGPIWNEFVEQLKTKQLDVISNMVQTPQRNKFAIFTAPIINEYPSIVSRVSGSYTNLESLKGKTLAVVHGSWHEEVFKRFYPEIKLYPTRSALENLLAVADGKAEATVGTGLVLQHIIVNNGLHMLKISGELRLKGDIDARSRIAVRDDWPQLRSAFDKAISALSYKELFSLKEKWCAQNSDMFNPLNLSAEEEQFLAKHRVIRVHNELNWPPFNFNENNVPKGFSVDYMNLIARKAGFFVEYVTGPTWNDFLGMIRDKKLDVMLNIVNTESRRDYIRFTEPYVSNPTVIVSNKDNIILSVGQLEGGVIAIPKGFFYEDIIKHDYPGVKILEVNDIIDALKAVAYKQADATVGELAVIDYLIRKHMFSNLSVSAEVHLAGEQYFNLSIGVRKDWEILQRIISKAMVDIDHQTLLELQNKWLKFDERKNARNIIFTAEEENYLHRKGVLKLCVHPDYMPYEKYTAAEGYQGVAADFIDIFRKALPVPVQIVPTDSWQDSVAAVNSGACDLLSFVNANRELRETMNFTDKYMSDNIVIVAGSDVIYLDGMNSLDGKRVGIVADAPYRNLLERSYPQIDWEPAASLTEVLNLVEDGSLYAAVGPLLRVTRGIRESGLSAVKIIVQTGMHVDFQMGVRKDEVLLREIMNKVIASVDEQSRNQIMRRWYVVDLQYVMNWGLLWKIGGVILVILCLLLYNVVSARRYNRSLTAANSALLVRNTELSALKEELERKNIALKQLAITDKLTGLNNRTKLDRSLLSEINRFERFGHEFGIILLDIDHFKSINDSYGHRIGDEVLVELATILRGNTRSTDVIGRWGGEEFLIICPETDRVNIQGVAQKLRRYIELYEFRCTSGITASMGVSMVMANDSPENLIERADKALYNAKNNGRNMVCTNC